jgi:hypothetical protein
MSGWVVLAFFSVFMVARYFWKQEQDRKPGHSHDGSGGVDGGGSDFSAKDFSWAPGHHHGGGGDSFGGHHHGGSSGDFSGGGDSDGGGGGDSGSF